MSEQESQEPRLFRVVQAQGGVSRRKAIDLILAGEVDVDGHVAADPFAPVAPSATTRLALRGHPLSLEAPEPRVYRFHKPAGVLCSHDDPRCGNTVGRALRAEGFIGYTWVGRLDQNAEGLLLVSNDGDLIQALTHPRYEVRKVYRVWLGGAPPIADLERALAAMTRGIEDAGETLRLLDGRVEGRDRHAVVTLAEGKKHEIKRLFAHFDLHVTRLLRIAVGGIELGALSPGAFERLAAMDERALRDDVRRLLASPGGSADRD